MSCIVSSEIRLSLAMMIETNPSVRDLLQLDREVDGYTPPDRDAEVWRGIADRVAQVKGIHYLSAPVLAVPESQAITELLNQEALEALYRSVYELANPLRSFKNSANNRAFTSNAYSAGIKLQEDYLKLIGENKDGGLSEQLGFLMPSSVRFCLGESATGTIQVDRKALSVGLWVPPVDCHLVRRENETYAQAVLTPYGSDTQHNLNIYER